MCIPFKMLFIFVSCSIFGNQNIHKFCNLFKVKENYNLLNIYNQNKNVYNKKSKMWKI